MMSKTTTRYVLTVAPDMARIKMGLWVRQTFYNMDEALYLAREFEKLGAIWYIETLESKSTSARGSCKEITDYWGE